MTTLTRHYRLAAVGLGSLLVVAVVALRSSVLLGALWGNSGFVQFNHILSQDISSTSLYSRTTAALQKATTYNQQRQSAWRALGYIAFLVGDEATAVRAWKNAPTMANEIIENGQVAQLADDQDAALSWFSLVTRIAPELADGWFFLGLAQESQGDWSLAVESYETAVSQPNRDRVGQSDPHFRLGRARWQVQGSEARDVVLAELQQALEADDFGGDWARVQAHYVRGVVLMQTGQELEAATEFNWIIKHEPDDYWAHVQLGLLAWEVDQDATAAEAWLQEAVELVPNNKWAYRYLGAVYEATGQNDQAAAMYQRVLALDPNDVAATAFLSQNKQ